MNAAQVQALIRMGLPMAEDIDFRVERLDERHALARIPFHGKLVRPGGTLSGPTIMALADAAMYAVILGRLGAVEMAVTSNLNINFLSKPRPEDLLAEASILKLGRRRSAAGGDYVFRLQALVPLYHRELHALAFDEDAVAFAANRSEVDEDVLARIAGNEAETF